MRFHVCFGPERIKWLQRLNCLFLHAHTSEFVVPDKKKIICYGLHVRLIANIIGQYPIVLGTNYSTEEVKAMAFSHLERWTFSQDAGRYDSCFVSIMLYAYLCSSLWPILIFGRMISGRFRLNVALVGHSSGRRFFRDSESGRDGVALKTPSSSKAILFEAVGIEVIATNPRILVQTNGRFAAPVLVQLFHPRCQ